MKMNIMTKLIWFAACAAVLLSAEHLAHVDDSAEHQASAPQAASGNAAR